MRRGRGSCGVRIGGLGGNVGAGRFGINGIAGNGALPAGGEFTGGGVVAGLAGRGLPEGAGVLGAGTRPTAGAVGSIVIGVGVEPVRGESGFTGSGAPSSAPLWLTHHMVVTMPAERISPKAPRSANTPPRDLRGASRAPIRAPLAPAVSMSVLG